MEIKDLKEAIAHHEEMMQYDLDAYRRGLDVGSMQSADRRLELAANHAAILTALKGMLNGMDTL